MNTIYSANSREYRLRHEKELIDQLSWINSAELMQVFLEPKHHKSLANVATPTLGGKQLWDTLWETENWKVQKCRVLGTVLPHYRILDPKNIRRAWYLSYKQFFHDVDLFANMIRQRLVMEDFRYGIVFSGGGGKGAYEIGVWKYLHEIGIDKKIAGISGASVGALNSLLFLQGDYQKAEDLWRHVEQGDFTYINPLEYLQALFDGISTYAAGPVGLGLLGLKALIQKLQDSPEKIRDVSFSFFSQDRLREIIDTYVSEEQVLANLSDKIVYSMLCDVATGAYPCCWSKRDFDNIRELVLTSAAMPLGIYPMRQFDGRTCIDGGMVDNIPVRPLMDDFHHIIVIHLQPKGKKEREAWIRSILGLKTADHSFYHVYPSRTEHMSSLWDTMAVNPEITQYRLELGYQDAKEQLTDLIEHEKSQIPVPNAARIHAILPSLRMEW